MDGSGSKSEACSVSNNLPDDEVTTWYFSRKELEKNSPSRRDGIDLKIETFLRKSYCSFLKDLGDALNVPRVTVATAIVLCHRFFSRQSHAKNDRWTIATVCMLLAGKVEEIPLNLKDVIIFSYKIKHKTDRDDDQEKEVYEKQKELVLSGEELVLSTLKFGLTVRHPYKPLAYAIGKHVAIEARAQFYKVAESFVNNCMWTSLCLQYKPHHIAGYAFFRAAENLAMDLQANEKGLNEEFNISLSQLEDIHDQMLERDAWYFSREEIEKNSPSKLDGIDLQKEAQLRKSYCTFLIDLGVRLNVPRVTVATAIVLCHRFFSRQSHAKNDRWTIATICMLLAGKVEDTPQDLKDIIVSSYEILHKTELDKDQRKKVYEEQKELVLSGEELVLSTLNFDLTVRHPYQPLAYAIGKYKVKESNALFPEVAEGIVNKCLQTTLSLQYKPHHIAGYGFFSATRLKMNPQLEADVTALYQEFDITRSQLEDMNGQMVEQSKNDSNESGTQNPDDNPVQEGTGKASESEA